MSRTGGRWLSLALAASPALITLYIILHYGIDFPFWDQWDPGFSGMFIKAREGQLAFGDLWMQHNEHRIFVPRLVYLVLGLLTRWNTVAEMLASWVTACISSGGILWLCRKSSRQVNGPVLFIWFLCNVCVFSIVQWENWLTGVGMVNVMGVMWLIGMVVVLSTDLRPWARVGGAMACAVLATFTGGSGLICWPLGLILLGWSDSWPELKVKRWMLLMWVGAGLISAGLYFYGYQPVHEPLARTPSLSERVRYVLAFVGSSYGPVLAFGWARTAVVMGSIQLILYGLAAGYFLHAWRIRRDVELGRRMLGWLVIGLYAVLAGMMGAVMRAHFDLLQAASSRYTTYSILMSIALVNLVAMICADLARRRAGPAGLPRLWLHLPPAAATLLLWLQFTLMVSLPAYIDRSLSPHYAMKAATLLMNVLPDNPWLRPNGLPEYPGMEDRARTLNQMGYLRPPLIETRNARDLEADESLAEANEGRWGAIQQAQVSADRTTISLSGYALSPDEKAPADTVLLTIENEFKQPIIVALADVNGPRLDIAERAGRMRLVGCGWSWTIPLPRPPLTLAAWAFDTTTGKAYKLGGQIAIVE